MMRNFRLDKFILSYICIKISRSLGLALYRRDLDSWFALSSQNFRSFFCSHKQGALQQVRIFCQ